MNIKHSKINELRARVKGKYLRTVDSAFFKRPLEIQKNIPYISFTFDDFPRSAWQTGGEILSRYNLLATYYASFGLMGTMAPVGEIFLLDDIMELISQGNELACHTYGHLHSSNTNPRVFEKSVIKNKEALTRYIPGAKFRSFSYPIDAPRPTTKFRLKKHFESCRYGGQTFNVNTMDLLFLKAFFLEKSRDKIADVKKVVDLNSKAKGWLIFATHDVSDSPSPFGCTPAFFKEIVKYASESGAKILPVADVIDSLNQKII